MNQYTNGHLKIKSDIHGICRRNIMTSTSLKIIIVSETSICYGGTGILVIIALKDLGKCSFRTRIAWEHVFFVIITIAMEVLVTGQVTPR